MSRLRVYRDNRPEQPHVDLSAASDIAAALAPHGVRFERWVLGDGDSGASGHELSAYAPHIARVQREHRYAAVDVVSMRPEAPERAAFRQKFLAEHSHDEDEVRLGNAPRSNGTSARAPSAELAVAWRPNQHPTVSQLLDGAL